MALVARSADDLGKVASGLRNDPVLIPSDLADPDAPAAVAAAAIEALGPVDVLVNNAGAGVRTDSTDLDAETIDRLLTLNVRNLLLLTIGLLPPMLERGRGLRHQRLVGVVAGDAPPVRVRRLQGRRRRDAVAGHGVRPAASG